MNDRPVSAGPDPSRVTSLEGLARELGRLRVHAARGTGQQQVSFDELTRRLGLEKTKRSTIHNYVTGKTLIPVDVLDRVVIALGATPAEQQLWGEAWYRVADHRLAARNSTRKPQARAEPHAGPAGTPTFLTAGQRAGLSTRDAEKLDRLADAIRVQWEAEERARQIHDPFPMPVELVNGPEDVADHWANIRRDPENAEPIDLAGPGESIVDIYARIPSGRLVLLGQGGAGKTVLASRFALGFLARRPSGEGAPVPLIVALSEWDPTRSSLWELVVDTLVVNYAGMGREEQGTSTALRLAQAGAIVPILDGFDELGETFRVAAINRLNHDLLMADRLVLTSRPAEYAAACKESDVITAAAVASVADLSVDDLAAYLPLTTRRTANSSGSSTKWDPVISRLQRSDPADVQAEGFRVALRTPLMVALARVQFSDTSASPNQLLELSRDPDPQQHTAAIEEYLLAGFIPSAYGKDVGALGQEADRSGRAIRWLTFLAQYLGRHKTLAIEWWRLEAAVPRVVTGIAGMLAVAVPVWFYTVLGALAGDWPDEQARLPWIVASAGFGAVGGMVSGVALALGYRLKPAPLPSRVRPRLLLSNASTAVRTMFRSLSVAWLLIWFGSWTGIGLLAGAMAAAVTSSFVPVVVGSATGLIAGLLTLFVIELMDSITVPVDSVHSMDPVSLLRLDRTTSLRQGLLVGLLGAICDGLALYFAFDYVFGLPIGSVFNPLDCLVGWLWAVLSGVVIWVVFFTTWGQWLLARWWLAASGQLPWHSVRFLEDARHRGVLRTSGGVYQFRHLRLQQCLLKESPPVSPAVR